MTNKIRKGIRRGLFACGVCTAALLVWVGFQLVPESSPLARGTEQAYMEDCINCHAQATGAPAFECAGASPSPAHPSYEGACSDLSAYFEAVRLKRTFAIRAKAPNPNSLMQGERLARNYNCFQCHGELGQGGFRNEGALKGYIPGYFGSDFAALTHNGNAESIRAWIQQGIDSSLLQPMILGTLAGFFVERQDVSMPQFKSLPESEVQILTNYVIALNQFGEMDASEIREYGRRTQQSPPVGMAHNGL